MSKKMPEKTLSLTKRYLAELHLRQGGKGIVSMGGNDFKETVKKAEKLIGEQDREIACLKKEIAKRKLAMAKSQAYIRECLPKRKKWNPFSR